MDRRAVTDADVPGTVPAPAADPSARGEADREGSEGGGAVARLQATAATVNDLDGLPVAEHAERYEAVHDQLQAALRDIDDQPG
jgi:hypothetical protein